MAPARIRRLLSRVAGTPRKVLRGLGRRLGVCERHASHIQECSDDGTDSSEFTGVSNYEIFPTQANSTCDEGDLVAAQLPVPLQVGPREEVGDTRSSASVCVHGDVPCGEQYLKLESDDKAEVVKVTPQDTQKDGPIVTTSAVYASHSQEDGYLGDGESSKDGESDDSASNLGDRESSKDGESDDSASNLGDRESSKDGKSDDSASNLGDRENRDGGSDYGTLNLGERDPADGEEHPAPPKYVSPTDKNKNLDLECNKVSQIQEVSPKMKKLPTSEQYNMRGYLNRQDQTELYDSGMLQLLISKQSPPKDLQKLSNTPSFLSPPLPIPPPLLPAWHTPPEKPPVRAPHRRKHQSSAKEISKKGNSKQRGKKQKKRHQSGRIINCGNSHSKAGSFGLASQSQGQSHTSNQGSGSVCIGQATRRKRRFQHQDGSSSSSGGKKSSGDSKSEIDSSSTSSDNLQPKKKKAKKKRHPRDKSSSEFETSEDVSTNPANVKEDSSLAFVSGSELELSSKPEDKASSRKSLNSFTSSKTKKSIKKPESGGSSSLSITESAKHSLPPTSIGDHQPADINELSPAAIGGLPLAGISNLPPTGIGDHHPGSLPPTGIGNHHPGSLLPTGIGDHHPGSLPPTGIGDHHPGSLPPTGIGDHHPGSLPPMHIPFRSLAEEEPVTQPLLYPSTLTHDPCARLVHNGIMPIQVHQEPSCWPTCTVEEFFEVCAVGDHQLLLSAVKVLGALLYCKLCFIEYGQTSVRILPAISVLCPEGCEWSLAVNVTACYGGSPETFRSFAMEIVRLLSILLEKWEAFHITERGPSSQLISLLQRVKSILEGALAGAPHTSCIT